MKASCGILCQHPECWRADLRKVKEAVRARNGIHTTNEDDMGFVNQRKRESIRAVEDSLPTLKVIDVFSGIDHHVPNLRHPALESHQHSNSLPSLQPATASFSRALSHSPALHTPRPSPVTPAVLTDYQKNMLWKKRFADTAEVVGTESSSGESCIHRVGVHEIFDQDELQQDWQDVYITSAYLVWCPSAKSKRRRKPTKSSSAKKVVPKDMTEDMVPAFMETAKQQRPWQRKALPGGQSHSPSWASHKNPHMEQHELSRDFVTKVELTQDSGEVLPQFQSSPRAADPAKQRGLELSLEAPLDIGSRVLLDVDIKSRFTTPKEADRLRNLEEHFKNVLNDRAKEWKPGAAPETSSNKEAEDKATSKQVRVPLPLSSIGVPTEDLPPVNLHHCPNSIPRNLQLGASLEPVDLVSITPSPAATPLETTIPQTQSQKTMRPHSSLFVNIPSEHDSVYDSPLYQYFPIRGHMTSALRFSPNPVTAPAPTPISPDRSHDFYQQQHLRNSHRPGGGKLSSNSIRRNSEQDSDVTWLAWRRATLSSVRDLEEDPSVQGRYSPVGQEWPMTSDHVFITEDRSGSTRTSPEPSRQEWLGGNMIVNMMNDANLGALRSPSPGSKTYIPQDILAEFQGDPYGKHTDFASWSLLADPAHAIVPENLRHTEILTTLSSTGWRLPRSRTPIQLSETVGRTAPKPMRQPPADSVPKSLTVKHLPTLREKRPKSTPPRVCSSRETAVQQVLSETSLVGPASSVTPAPPCNDGGPMPPPPSPELHTAAIDESRLEALSEVDECSSIVLSNSHIAKNAATATTDSVNAERGASNNNLDETDANACLQHYISHNTKYIDEDLRVTDRKESDSDALEEVVQSISPYENAENIDIVPESTFPAQADELTTDVNQQTNAHSAVSPAPPTSNDSGKSHPNRCSSEPGEVDAALLINPVSVDGDNHQLCLMRASEELRHFPETAGSTILAEEPHPPGSPELAQSDFSEGLDLNLDLEMELKMAMEGLDDLVRI